MVCVWFFVAQRESNFSSKPTPVRQSQLSNDLPELIPKNWFRSILGQNTNESNDPDATYSRESLNSQRFSKTYWHLENLEPAPVVQPAQIPARTFECNCLANQSYHTFSMDSKRKLPSTCRISAQTFFSKEVTPRAMQWQSSNDSKQDIKKQHIHKAISLLFVSFRFQLVHEYLRTHDGRLTT